MELGFTDVLLILVVASVFYFMLRQKAGKRAALRAAQAIKISRPTQAEIQEALQRERQKKARQLRLRILSGALIVTGAGILLEVTGVLKYVTLGYAMSGTLLICGAGVLLLSTRR
jgi:preprotein translocase subunit YajC